ncbi:hypothetical protein HPB50_005146 [Hyalomma asiaticum]|uniref:Uncharacterized protein n=1 Tax=Hyalomma asiaticum TaxID=266040 RepID=A0ACB7RP90_HYAAI|nr:hypothetical protein HPB50_005146 [Hyalomma asiaticum]
MRHWLEKHTVRFTGTSSVEGAVEGCVTALGVDMAGGPGAGGAVLRSGTCMELDPKSITHENPKSPPTMAPKIQTKAAWISEYSPESGACTSTATVCARSHVTGFAKSRRLTRLSVQVFPFSDMERQEAERSSVSSSGSSKKRGRPSRKRSDNQSPYAEISAQSTANVEPTADTALLDQERTGTSVVQEGSRVKKKRRPRKDSAEAMAPNETSQPDQSRTATNVIQEGSKVKKSRRARKSSSDVIQPDDAGQPDQDRTATSAIQEGTGMKRSRSSRKSSSGSSEQREARQPEEDRTATSAAQETSQVKKKRRSRKSSSEAMQQQSSTSLESGPPAVAPALPQTTLVKEEREADKMTTKAVEQGEAALPPRSNELGNMNRLQQLQEDRRAKQSLRASGVRDDPKTNNFADSRRPLFVTAVLSVFILNAMAVLWLLMRSWDSEEIYVMVPELGTFRGLRATVEDQPVYMFRGIKFARSPEGLLRFAPASALSERNTTDVDARIPKPWVCQKPYEARGRVIRSNEGTSEDCLHLNVWTPCTESTMPSCRKTVLVFLHAIEFQNGDNNYYDGRWLSGLGQLVVVAPNFRLGAFGFFNIGTSRQQSCSVRDVTVSCFKASQTYRDVQSESAYAIPRTTQQTPHCKARSTCHFSMTGCLLSDVSCIPADVALDDQRLAVRWVINHISSFGGNASDVVLMGSGSGAWSVGAHLLKDGTEGPRFWSHERFAKVILMSESPFRRYFGDKSRELPSLVHCSAAGMVEMLHCMRVVSSHEILRATSRVVSYFGPSASAHPSVEDVPRVTGRRFLMGTVSNEGTHLLDYLRRTSRPKADMEYVLTTFLKIIYHISNGGEIVDAFRRTASPSQNGNS